MKLFIYIIENWEKVSLAITFCITSFITLASAIVKFLPTLRKDNPMLPTVKVLSQIAMNRNTDDNAERDKITAIDEITNLNKETK